MKIIIQDRKGKQMMFETLYEVEELGSNCKTFVCDEWLLTDVENWSGWMDEQESEKVISNSTTPRCVRCETAKDVKYSSYDFFPYCKEHNPLL